MWRPGRVWAGGALQELWVQVQCPGTHRCWRVTSSLSGSPRTARYAKLLLPSGLKRRSTSSHGEGRTSYAPAQRRHSRRRAQPVPTTPPHRWVPALRLLGPTLLPEDPRGWGGPSDTAVQGSVGAPAPCGGLEKTMQRGRPPRTPCHPALPRPRAFRAQTCGERGQPSGSGEVCGAGATWLEATDLSSHLAFISKL